MIAFKFQELILSGTARRDKLVLVNLAVGLLANVILWIILVFNFWGSVEYIILRYNIYFGISSFGPWWRILLLPLIGLLILVINFGNAFYFHFHNRILSYFLSFGAAGLNIILLAAGLLLIYINL